MSADDLAAWIEELRGRLDAGEFRDHPPIRLDPTIELGDPERAIGAMLRDADHFGRLPPEERDTPWMRGQRQLLARQFRQLRERLAGIPPPPFEGPRQI